jgi:hypothetical protein
MAARSDKPLNGLRALDENADDRDHRGVITGVPALGPTGLALVGRAKARTRRARRRNGGHASLCPPYGPVG